MGQFGQWQLRCERARVNVDLSQTKLVGKKVCSYGPVWPVAITAREGEGERGLVANIACW